MLWLVLPSLLALLAACAATSRPRPPAAASPVGSSVASPVGSSVAARGPCGVLPAGSAHYTHVIWIWFENASFGQVVGVPSLPYLDRLAAQCGLETDYHGVRHPSLPNYLAAATGRDPGPIGDCEPAACPQHGSTIFAQLGAGGWAAYDESMPAACDPVTSGSYAARHNPAVYFASIYPACRRDDVGLGGLATALAAGRLPRFSWITPNICDDMHSCPDPVGDSWLADWLPRILASSAYRAGSVAVFLTWDESSGASATNHIALYVIAPSVPVGARVGIPATHFALLRTTETLLGLPLLGSAVQAPSLVVPFHL